MPRPKETRVEKLARQKGSAILWAESLYAYKLIARAIGVTEQTLIDWRAADEQFNNDLEESRLKFISRNVKKAKPEFLLERLESEIFKERKETELIGNLGVAVSAEQAEQLIRARAKRTNS